MAYAAETPIGVASRQVAAATCKLTPVANIHSALAKYSLYQRTDQAGGGKARKRDAEKDIGTTIKIGSTRKTKPAMPTKVRARRAAVVVGKYVACMAQRAPNTRSSDR